MGILNINSGGNGTYIRFAPSINGWMKGKEEISIKMLVLDIASVKTGWGKMAEGSAPEWHWDQQLGVAGSRPSEEKDAQGQPVWKRGFSARLYSKEHGTVEWSSTGTGPCLGFDAIFEEVWNAKQPGKAPVIEYTGAEPLKIGKGNTRKPLFRLVKWVGHDSIPWDAEAPAAPPPPVQQAKAPPPKQADDDLEF